jgi:hypothetical protein
MPSWCIEVRVALDDLAVGLDAEVAHEGPEAIQDLGDAPALARRVHMDEPPSLHAAHQAQQEVPGAQLAKSFGYGPAIRG